MKKLNLMKIASLVIALLATSSLFAQGVKDIRFNEVFAKNTLNADGVLEKDGWIEITNIGYTTVDLGGCRLVKISPSGTTTHVIPKGLNTTYLAPQNYLLIYTGAEEEYPLTTTFNIDDATELQLYDASGKGLLDKVVFNSSDMREGKSLGRAFVDRNSLKKRRADADIETRVSSLVETGYITPAFSNFPAPAESRSEAFRNTDPSGGGMAVIAMSVVFIALLCLFGVFAQVGSIMQKIAKKKETKVTPVDASTSVSNSAVASVASLDGDTIAAIGFAIKMYNDELNESEARVITINRTVKAYSPWSSKIYGLTQLPNKK